MNEAETRAEHIDPAVQAAGWGVVEGSRVHREHFIAPGRIEGHGKKGRAEIADYVLVYKNTKLAVIEAKAWDKPLTEGLGQAKSYANKLSLRWAFSTNGQGIYRADMEQGAEGEVPVYPSPEELWNLTFAEANAWRERFAAVPFEDCGGTWAARYYQETAIERVLEAIATNRKRVLLTLATGTGKTFIAFQLAWKLFQSRWNLSGEPTRRPRILFLADRNILANQAYNAFSAFPDDALVRIAPDEIRKKGKVPTSGSIFFTIFQTFASTGSATGDSGNPRSVAEPAEVTLDEIREIRPAYGYMYVLECADGTFYIGSTVNLQLRLVQHRQGDGAKHTKARLPAKLIYYECFDRIDEAFAREKQIQRWSRAKKFALIQGDIERLKQLSKSKSGSGPVSPTVSVPEPVEGYFGGYEPDFFDFIIIDECHRGGANDESSWRGILDYFAPAVQLGLTATPKRKDNVDTYAYFGEPVYVYSLKEGINDGFLTPFKVKQFSTTLDEYVFTPDDRLIEGEIEQGKRYKESDFNRIIEIKQREEYRVRLFLSMIAPNEKTLIFCATQEHALAVRDLINQISASNHPNYCARVTANDGAIGDQHLRDFQDNEKTIPAMLTTSQKLSTGVDARNVRNIVLMRPVNSMIEFKQIIGRGTRLYEGKEFFTIYDFVKAHQHFSDPEWDGEPLDHTKEKMELPEVEKPVIAEEEKEYDVRNKKVRIKLADGKERAIQHMMSTSFWSADGTPMSAAQFLENLYGALPDFFKDEAELRALWSEPATRRAFLDGLAEKGFGPGAMTEMQKIIEAERSDLFDVLAYVAFALPPLAREERAARAKLAITSHFNPKQQVFLDFVLSQYVKVGVDELAQEKLSPLLKLKYHNAIADAVADLGPPEEIGQVFAGFQKFLYREDVA
ncbi:MAG: DEAD/DEAH box helicase family protein [Verrucomicrobiota bacterium]